VYGTAQRKIATNFLKSASLTGYGTLTESSAPAAG